MSVSVQSPPEAPRCRFLRRHRWRRTEDLAGLRIACSRCGWGWYEPRLFLVEATNVPATEPPP
jgi:hypothetical protein